MGQRPAILFIPSSPSLTTAMETCRGTTKKNASCSIWWGLNKRGYCKYHDPIAHQCRGIARSTGSRCKISWDLNSEGYCIYHGQQFGPRAQQCIAITQASNRCRQMNGIDPSGYCALHRPTNLAAPICQALRCTNNAKSGYDYCCAGHDPSFASSYFSPHFFHQEGLRDRCEDQVIAMYSKRDLYNSDILDLKTPGFVELDHIVEKQCFSHAFHFLDLDGREDVDFVTSIVRDKVVNELQNICFTRTTTNRIKGAAVWRFLDDRLTGHLDAADTFTSYLMSETRDGVHLGRKTTRTIIREMGTALKYCQRRLAEEGETPILEAVSSQLQELYAKMDFRTKQKSDDDLPHEPKELKTDESKVLKSALNVNAKSFVPQATKS